MYQDFYLALKKSLEKRKTEISYALISGTIPSWEEYKLVVGKRLGIEEAQKIMMELLKKLEDGDRESEE